MDMVKFREMFLAEAADHLRQMTTTLIALEADPGNCSGIDALFRNAHSIKGMAGTMNFGQTANLAHFLEDILDECRQAGHIGSQQIDKVLSGVDLLETLMEDIRSGQPEREVSLFTEHQSAAAQGADKEVTPGDQDLVQIDLDDPLVFVRVLLEASTPAPGARLLVLLKTMEKLGTVVEARPAENALIAGNDNSRELFVKLETALLPDQLSDFFKGYSEIKEIGFPQGFSTSCRACSGFETDIRSHCPR